ncbi:unnamed protein product [Somion occarium]|uniref:J domain-containing protein n=1 Tax=Somion occarium TaxID=3059160 RepID=A0ABP1DWV2_9APHY
MASVLVSIAGWTFLPDFATRQLLPYFHRAYQRIFKRPPPAPQTPLYFQHYRYVYTFVVLSYLFYNFREAALSMSPNYYEILGVSPSSDDATLKSAFRSFAKKFHPDRVGQNGEALFMEVRDAFEALKNPVTRFAYDRFGPDALSWKNCTTLREYIRHGLMQSTGFHIASLCTLLLFSSVGKPSPIAFWRYLLFAFMFVYELLFLLSPSPSPPSSTAASSLSSISSFLFSDSSSRSATKNSILSLLWPNRVAYQHVRFLHSLSILLSVAFSRVAPVLFPSQLGGEYVDPKVLKSELGKVFATSQIVLAEATKMVDIELHSVHGAPTGVPPTAGTFPSPPPLPEPADSVMNLITIELENMIIEGKLLKEEGPMKSAVESALERRKWHGEALDNDVVERERNTGFVSPTRAGPSTPRRMLGSIGSAFGLGGASRGSPGVKAPPEGYVRGRSLSC